MITNDFVQRDAVCVRDLNIASSEYRTDDIDLGRVNRSAAWTTLLLLNFFVVVVARSDARLPGMRPVADSILTSGTHSWEEIGHEKSSKTIISLPLIQERQLSVTGKRMCTNDTGKLPIRFAREQYW